MTLYDSLASWLQIHTYLIRIEYLLAKQCKNQMIHVTGTICRSIFKKLTTDFIQYFVYPPFAFNTVATCLGMLSIRSIHTCIGIFSHSACTCSQSLWIPTGSVS